MSLYFNGGSISAGSGGGSDDTYTKAEINGLLSAKSNTGLDNLNANGQLIIDTQNGTISNCILEIPQNLKLTLENNVLTLKAGSTVVLTGSTYTTSTNTSDIARTLSLSQGRYYIWRDNSTTIASPRSISDVTSGTTPPETATINFGTFYNINDKYCYQYTSNGWVKREEWSYPLCIIDVDSQGNASFAKDSNGNDMIFNGAGFIGHHAFVYPNVKGLWANGIDTDGILKSSKLSLSSLLIIELKTEQDIVEFYSSSVLAVRNYIGEYDNVSDLPNLTSLYYTAYVKSENAMYYKNRTADWSNQAGKYLNFIKYAYDGTSVTQFDIRQPYEGARNLLTDDIEEEVATKQADVTTLAGYDSTQTQTLKNINGVLTWVTD